MFLDFLAGRARQAQALYILGDLFETWIGDDDIDDRFNARIVAGLRAATEAGLQIGLLHGNRDFLLGQGFADAAGIRLLPDPYDLVLADWSFVLSHGDALCLDDTDYQAFRARVRNAAWQRDILAKPRFVRRLVARWMRWRSHARQQNLNTPYSDLQAAATDDFIRDRGYVTFIHGHTHQPATHDHIVDGIHVERWVLADWHEDRGECLVWDGKKLRREPIVANS